MDEGVGAIDAAGPAPAFAQRARQRLRAQPFERARLHRAVLLHLLDSARCHPDTLLCELGVAPRVAGNVALFVHVEAADPALPACGHKGMRIFKLRPSLINGAYELHPR